MSKQQIPKLVACIVEHQNNFSVMSKRERQWVIQNTSAAISLFVKAVESELMEEEIDSIVYVDRDINPKYPDTTDHPVNLELEKTGPTKFDVADVKLWWHPDQSNGVVRGNVIYEHFNQSGILENCLGLRDLEEIQNRGSSLFKKFFLHKAVFGWKSVVKSNSGESKVPYLIEYQNRINMYWISLDDEWDSSAPALCFNK